VLSVEKYLHRDTKQPHLIRSLVQSHKNREAAERLCCCR